VALPKNSMVNVAFAVLLSVPVMVVVFGTES
jgi:hypothetical protein